MNNKFTFFVLISICGLVCAGSVSAYTLNTTDTISTNTDSKLNLDINTTLNSQVNNDTSDNTAHNNVVSDSNITSGNQSKPLTDLKNLLSKGSGNYTLTDDYQYNSSLDKDFKVITISSGDYVINGNNHIIDGALNTSLFNITGGHVTLFNINCINFAGNESVIYAKNCDLNMSKCILINNIANSIGNGTVYLDNVNANIYENSFINNIGKNGAAIYAHDSNLALISNVFNYNLATGKGGAVYVAGSRITSSLNNYKNNTADNGGAIYFDEKCYNSSAMIDMFINNVATSNGGAIYSLTNNSVFVTNSGFMDNTAKKGKSICAEKGIVYSKANTFDNETAFTPSWNTASGNCRFISIGIQNIGSDDNIVPIIDFVEAMGVNPTMMHYNTYNTSAYFATHYSVAGVPGSLAKNLMQLSELNISNKNPFTTTSSMSLMLDMDKKMMDYIKAMQSVKPTSSKMSQDNPFVTIDSSVVMSVCNDKDLENAKYLASSALIYNPLLNSTTKINKLILTFEKNHIFKFNTQENNTVFSNIKVDNLFLNGDNTTFKVINPYNRNEFHFMTIDQNKTVILSSLTISGFNTAIENNGLLCLRNTVLSQNIVDYTSDPDYGGAIKNLGVIIGENSSFIDNYAKYGGAIYNLGYVHLVNCSFSNNTGYSDGNDIYNFQTGQSNLTNTTCSVVHDEGPSVIKQLVIQVGGTIVAIIGTTLVGWIPGINLIVAGVAGLVIGGFIAGGSALWVGYLEHNINWKTIAIEAAIGATTGAISALLSAAAARAVRAVKAQATFLGDTIDIAEAHARGFTVYDFLHYEEYIQRLTDFAETTGKTIKMTVLSTAAFYQGVIEDVIYGYYSEFMAAFIFSGIGHYIYGYYGIQPPTIPQNLTIPKTNII